MRLSIILLLICVCIYAQTDTACSYAEANVTAIYDHRDIATRNNPACCETCNRCGTEDCCGYNSGTNKCYFCTNGTCCGDINDLSTLGCCRVGTECCLDCSNTTYVDQFTCVDPGTCTCSPANNTCLGDVCCPKISVCGATCCEGEGTCCGTYCCGKGDTCCGDGCCKSGEVCCNGQCCAAGSQCCNGECCAASSSCCSYTKDQIFQPITYYQCCDISGGSCCGDKCCSNTQQCFSYNYYDTEYSCCNANVTFTPSGCHYDFECGSSYKEDWSCCYGCCCPGNYTCDDKTRQCIYVIGRGAVTVDGLAIGLGYGIGLGLLYMALLCCIPRRMALSSLKPVFKRMGYVSGAQFVLMFLRLILYAVYPFSEDFKVGIAAIVTGFYTYLTGMLMPKRHYEQWLVIYAVLFVLNFILTLACFFMEFINLESDPAFAILVTATVITVLIDIPWAVYFVSKVYREYKNPTSNVRKRNKVELLDHCKAKSSISAVSSVDTKHSLITKHFYEAWTKGSTTDVNIHYILKLKHPLVSDNFRSYKKKVAGENKGDPNVMQMFHATKLSEQCKIATSYSLCKNHDCSVCGISRKGFKITHSGLNIKFSRFGQGLYFAPNSSKANDYNNDSMRAMFYCKVVTGRQYETEYDKSDLVAAPTGYHSVHGKVGARLNYPEVVVYTEQAVKPTHLIIYSVGNVV